MPIKLEKHYSLFLYIGFGALLLTFVLLTAFYFNRIVYINKTLSNETNNNAVQLHAALNMRVSIRERALLVWQMTFQDDYFLRDELYQKFSLYGTKYLASRSKYLSSDLSADDKLLMAKLDYRINTRATTLRQFADRLMSDSIAEGDIDKDYINKINQTLSSQTTAANIIDEIIRIQEAQNEEVRKLSAEQTAETLYHLLLWMIALIATVSIFAQIIVKGANRQSSKLEKANTKLEKLARHDHLTGLPNRLYLQEHLEQTLLVAKRRGTSGALLYIDLDNFKPINDNYGHDVGDEFLKTIARETQILLRDSDLLARLGGDEFVVILFEIFTENDAVIVAEKLLKILSAKYTIGDVTVSASASIGICVFPGDDMSVSELLTLADKAMYNVKQQGKNGYYIQPSN